MRFFISHSSEDKWVARKISQDIEKLGAETFLDEKDIDFAEPIAEKVKDNLESCTHFLVLLSPTALASGWVSYEIGAAEAKGKPIIPVFLNIESGDIPDYIDVKGIKLNEINTYYNRIEQELRENARFLPPVREYPAIIFTHFQSLKHNGSTLEFQAKWDMTYRAQYELILRSYCKCNITKKRIGIVYIYIDDAVGKFLEAKGDIKANTSLDTPNDIQLSESDIKNSLEDLIADVTRNMSNIKPPEFKVVGLDELKLLLNYLRDSDPDYLKRLCGENYNFTYDSPKFVEAVIRLARSETPHLADTPIIRMDQDTRCNENFIASIVETYLSERKRHPFFYFSGKYCGDDGSESILNAHAVRVACFADPSKPRGSQMDSHALELANQFLADFTELGAKQLSKSQDYSEGLKNRLTPGTRSGLSSKRESTQVISGAGLIMSSRAISVLPPFMNFGTLTTWVDDFLKRLLHEVIEDLYQGQVECVSNATVIQDRYPGADGVTAKDIQTDIKNYFVRLLRGCMLKAIIIRPDGKATSYSEVIKELVRDKRLNVPVGNDLVNMKKDMKKACRQKLDDVLASWTSPEFSGSTLYIWATEKNNDPRWKNKVIDLVIKDAINYMQLVKEWPIFVRAIRRLHFQLRWLFLPV